MKLLLTGLLAIVFYCDAAAQRIDSAAVAKLSPENRELVYGYWQQAKEAKTTALVLTIGGGVLAVAGAVLISSSLDWSLYEDNSASNSRANFGGILLLAGAGSALGSIPFWIKIHKKRNAARAILYQGRGATLSRGITVPGTCSYGVQVQIPIDR